MIAVDCTRGLDVGATEYIRSRLVEESGRGTAILLISTDLDEIFSISDRIGVIYEGRMRKVFDSVESTTREEVGLYMAGGNTENIANSEAAP